MSDSGRITAPGQVGAREFGRRVLRRLAARVQVWQVLVALVAIAAIATAVIATRPGLVQAQDAGSVSVWRSSQFGLKVALPPGWHIVEQRTDPERGDVVILGNETSALLVGLLHDTRTPREMADDLIIAQKTQTPDLAVVDSSVTETGAILMFLQYTIQPGTDASMLIDEKALVGALEPGVSTITVRGMVPDRADVETEFELIEGMIGTLTPDR